MPGAGLEAAIAEDGTSSSGSLERLRRFLLIDPRFADDMLGLRGELPQISRLQKRT
jgi:hypothetical protein